MRETKNIQTDYEYYLKEKKDDEFIQMCKRSYNQISRDENLEHLLAKT